MRDQVSLCLAQYAKPIANRRNSDEYSREPAKKFYVVCQREVGHEGAHVGHYFGAQVHWESK
jgi:hypothetical protein